ncbi:virulence protein RhuM/Fic/DOC family protein [uncultured Flavobacterium sp.]|uniref:virulence protein RhuM/Fic/DOC family protein n=1 Tax=uncultured Flavobacterium sp. TaxID=165435 RepID=UPI002597DA22|nr:virulence protein RhuM/Fic/DOC family protein [uncultured Flavobacterium sp.]
MENQIEIYKSSDNAIELQVSLDNDTVWLNRNQLAILFDRDVKTIGKHINNVFLEGELSKKAVVANFATTAIDGKTYQVDHYNLDVIISVGYRVKSKQGTQFRQWATQRLKDYLVKGYALNEKRLQEATGKFQDLKNAVKLAAKAGNIEALTSVEAKGILGVIEQYAYALETLDKYDHQRLTIETPNEETEIQKLTYENAIQQIIIWRDFQKAGNLFGNEKDQSFKSSLETIYQTFDGIDLYPTIEEKAANLLYYVVKNHSFSDGNKRIAAGLFVYFLAMNNKLLNEEGNKRIGDNALVAITIMIAESKSDEKDMMVKLVVNLINNKNE